MNLTPKPQKKRELTRKEKALVQHIISNPKDSNTDAALAVYDTDSPRTASVIAARTLAREPVKMELAKYSNQVENTLYDTVLDWGRHDKPRQREIAQQAAMYIHDKVHGKATQQIETRSTTMSINIDLTTEPTDTEA